MKRIDKTEIKSLTTYDRTRDEFRSQIMKIKADRRIHLAPFLTFLFENHETVLYQIQEMIRVEKMTDENDIAYEIETYNELIGDAGELGCTLMIEIEDQKERSVKLAQWIDLLDHVHIRMQNGETVPAIYDKRQIGKGRISSVHYLKFKIGDQVPAAIQCSHPTLQGIVELSPDQIAALCKDLIS